MALPPTTTEPGATEPDTSQPDTSQPHTIQPDTTTSRPTKEPTMTSTLTPDIVSPDTRTTDQPNERRHTTHSAHRVTFGRLVSSEWLKFRTVRTNIIALGGAGAAAVGFGALFSSLAGSGTGPDNLSQNALSLSLGGFRLAEIVIAILGVALVAGEYQSGLIRTWFGAAPNRLRVLAAKTTVYGGLVFVVALAAAALAFTIGQAVLPADWVALSLGSDGVIQALVGTAFYAAIIAVIGVGLGFLLRSTAAGAGVVVTMLMIAPAMIGLLPSSISDPLGKILPSNAASAMQGVQSSSDLLSAPWGVAVLLAWAVAVVGSAAISLVRRDA